MIKTIFFAGLNVDLMKTKQQSKNIKGNERAIKIKNSAHGQ
jgi:hypothetical protein